MRLAKQLWSLTHGFSLQNLRYACRLQDAVPGRDVHSAAFDAACCAVLLPLECRALTDAGQAVTPALLRDRSATPPLLARVPFSRLYRGWLWRDVPRSFCQWILNKHNAGNPFDPEIVITAEAALRGIYAVPSEGGSPCGTA